MTDKPYLIDAIVGNSRLLAALTADGELQRIFWPHVDGGQHVQRLLGGVSVGGQPVSWRDGSSFAHQQAYEPDQNVVVTASRVETGVQITTRDAATMGRDVLIRHVTVTNQNPSPVIVTYAAFAWWRVDESPLYNTILYDAASDSLVHYRRDTFIALGADREMDAFTVGHPIPTLEGATGLSFGGGNTAMHGGVAGAGTIVHGDVAGAARWDLGLLAPGESAELTLLFTFGRSLGEVRQLMAESRQAGGAALLSEVRTYWTDWLARGKPLNVAVRPAASTPLLPGLPAAPASPEQVVSLYKRSLLVFKLLSDEQTGAVIAAPEFDPASTQCGGYAYCWGRDAAYITTAMDYAGYHDLAAGFYRWAVAAQEPEGWWMHRQYVNGNWGPSWGLLQIDETGSILYGMAVHARLHGGTGFARTVWSCVARAAEYLIGHLDPETGLASWAYDLWEERLEQITYSAAAVYAGLKAAADLAALVDQAEAAGRYSEAADQLQAAVIRECVRGGRFLRGRYLQVSREKYEAARAAGIAVRERVGIKGHTTYEIEEDAVPDASLFGLTTPFGLVPEDHPAMQQTADLLVQSLWMVPGGGVLRYVGDPYRGGRNPWVLCTLWLGLYKAEAGDTEFARQILDWTVSRRTANGLLPEQVDPYTGAPVWVVPLTWSHAMYVLLALELYGS